MKDLTDFVVELQEMASREMFTDEPMDDLNDAAGGSIDTAYTIGFKDGQIKLARELVALDLVALDKAVLENS